MVWHLSFCLSRVGCTCVGILPYIFHRATIAEVRSEYCNNLCCTTTSILHARLQKQADELAEKTDLNACVHVLRTRDLAVTQAKKLFESRGWWTAIQELMESSKQGRIKNEKDDDEYSDSTVESTLQCKSYHSRGENRMFCEQGQRRDTRNQEVQAL